jgi:Tfp pilus assembly protein PilO
MPTIEERLQAIEREHAELKKTLELQTIAIGALVNKTTLERLKEQYDKLFDTLIAHDHFTNQQLAELRGQLLEQDGKIVGLQTEMRQRFASIETEMRQRFASIETEMRQRFDEHDRHFIAIETEMRQRFTNIETALAQLLARLPEKP